jgi:hypothetical protein
MRLGTCTACQQPDVRLAPSTTDCTCLVCEDCGNTFLDQEICGVCQIPFTDDPPWGDESDER